MKITTDRLIKCLHFVFDFVIISAIMLLVFFAVFTAWETGRIYRASDAEQLASYKPAAGEDLSFEELKKINPEVIAWLDLYGTPIDYPVVQAENNTKYINQDIFGSFSLTGALFLDHNNSPDFSDFNNIIFGHHMERDKMFGNLDEFRKQEYLKAHSTGNLFAGGRDYGIRVFAWIHADAYDPDIYNTRIDAGDDREILLQMIREKAAVFVDEVADPRGRMLLLSTCGTDTTNERYILACAITDETYPDPYPEDEKENSVLEGGAGFLKEHPLICCLLILLILAVIGYSVSRKRKNRRCIDEKIDEQDDEQ